MVRYQAPPEERVPRREGERERKPLSANLSELRIGSLTLSPAFSADVTEYAASTTNATNTVTATAEDDDATVSLKLNGSPTGNAVTWASGDNTLTVTVTNGTEEKAYTIAVTKLDDDF